MIQQWFSQLGQTPEAADFFSGPLKHAWSILPESVKQNIINDPQLLNIIMKQDPTLQSPAALRYSRKGPTTLSAREYAPNELTNMPPGPSMVQERGRDVAHELIHAVDLQLRRRLGLPETGASVLPDEALTPELLKSLQKFGYTKPGSPAREAFAMEPLTESAMDPSIMRAYAQAKENPAFRKQLEDAYAMGHITPETGVTTPKTMYQIPEAPKTTVEALAKARKFRHRQGRREAE